MFEADLKLGKVYEKIALKFFDYNRYKQSKGNNKKYDLKLYTNDENERSKIIKVEVKCDRKAYKTNNIVIEYECNNKPSGINATKSDYYIYFILGTDIVYKIDISSLKFLCLSCRTVCGGDGMRSKMYILPMTRLKNYIVTLDE